MYRVKYLIMLIQHTYWSGGCTVPESQLRVDVDRAVEYAESAFRYWRKVPAPKRGEILFRAAEILVRDKECIARGMTQEMGKTLAETMR